VLAESRATKALTHFSWEGKMAQPLWKAVWHFLGN
jgi:hypothetical protein